MRVTTAAQDAPQNIPQASSEQAPIRIDIWSDIACPWCYIGKRKLEAALALPEAAELLSSGREPAA